MSWWRKMFGMDETAAAERERPAAPSTIQQDDPPRKRDRSWFQNEKGHSTIYDGPWRIVVTPKELFGREYWQYLAALDDASKISFSHFVPTEAMAKQLALIHRAAYDDTGRAPVIGLVELAPSLDDDLLDIVGESHYQDALALIAGPKTEDGADHKVGAFLIPDPDNPYDKNAVEIVIADKKVGHLSRDDNEEFLEFLQDVGASQAVCQARIQGGWKNDRSEGSYCVRLDIDWPPESVEN